MFFSFFLVPFGFNFAHIGLGYQLNQDKNDDVLICKHCKHLKQARLNVVMARLPLTQKMLRL